VILTLLLILAGFVGIVTLLTYTLYCYEETNRSGRPLAPFLAMAGRTALRSVASELAVVALHPFGLWPGLWSRPTQGRPLVILVHGLFHNPGAWALFRHRLHARGWATACFAYASWGTDWEPVVENLKRYLKNLAESHPHEDMHLVGHSMGGLLLRCALADLDEPRIRTLVTLGTPFEGSKLSPFALSSLGRYLRYRGETVSRIASLPTPGKLRCLALRSPADNMVLPNSALRCGLAGWEERQTRPVSHVAMLHSREVFEETAAWIGPRGRD
jgi:pimeloyl-ACP methyl ester carboxylesterase